MQYVYISSPDIVVKKIVDTLSQHLQAGEQVIWLLAGGSAITLEAATSHALQVLDTSRLSITLADERYGPLEHPDENYVQLMKAGFPLPIARVLTGQTAQATTVTFGEHIEQILDSADFSLGIFGIGADGHTAGIKPHSPAVTSTEPAIAYKWDDFERITITPPTIRRLDEVIIYAVGSEKIDTLRSLINEQKSVEDHPAQVLKDVKVSTLYTDNIL